MSRQALDELKQQIRLLDYLQGYDWQPARQLSRGRLMGLRPLHGDQKPSFLVDTSKGLFYCYGCDRDGDWHTRTPFLAGNPGRTTNPTI